MHRRRSWMTINQELSKRSQDGSRKNLQEEKMGKNIHWDVKERWTGMKSAKRLIYTLAKKICELLIWAQHGRETDQYPTSEKSKCCRHCQQIFLCICCVLVAEDASSRGGLGDEISLLWSLWRWGKNLWKIPQVTGMAIVKVRIRINAHLAHLTLQLCLILCCPS